MPLLNIGGGGVLLWEQDILRARSQLKSAILFRSKNDATEKQLMQLLD